jgi:hypothetical protein
MTDNPTPKEGQTIQFGTVQTAEQIEAHGNNQVRLSVIRYGFGLVIALVIGGCIAWVHDPTSAKELWGYIMQISLPTITGVIGYLAGDSRANHKTRP